MTGPSFLAGISTVTSDRSVSSSGTLPVSNRSRVLHGRHGTRITVTHSRAPAATRNSIFAQPEGHCCFGVASSGLLCSAFRSPQRTKTPLNVTRNKAMQTTSQRLRQKIGKSSIVVNMAESKASRPASVQTTIFNITVRSCIFESPLEIENSSCLRDLQGAGNIDPSNSPINQKKPSFSLFSNL